MCGEKDTSPEPRPTNRRFEAEGLGKAQNVGIARILK